VTNGRYQELEFNGSFSAMNRKSGRSTPDPFLTAAILESGQSARARFRRLANYKPAVGDLTQPAKTGHSRSAFILGS
jgi:hypothetical protein